ncbi:MAG: helix-turn-helix transcriptional regulator [Acidimicrobiales bacterium]
MRASRLMAILLHLQSAGGVTAPRLAEELGVSVRTIYRDVSALQAAGVPLWTETGPGGGIRLVDGWRSDLDGLTTDEAMALFVGGPVAAVDQLGLGPFLAAAQVKVLATMPPAAARRAEEGRARFLLDAPGWFHRDEPTEALATIAAALWTDHRVDLTYRRGERTVARRVEPLGLVLKAGTWYLVARHRGGLRTYRVSRVVTAAALEDRFERPAGFDLAAAWAETSEAFDRSLLRLPVRLRLSPEAQRRLPATVPSAATVDALAQSGEPDADGWRTVDLWVESESVAHGQLLALGAGFEVIEPLGLRRSVAATASEMAHRNGRGVRANNWTPARPGDKDRPR